MDGSPEGFPTDYRLWWWHRHIHTNTHTSCSPRTDRCAVHTIQAKKFIASCRCFNLWFMTILGIPMNFWTFQLQRSDCWWNCLWKIEWIKGIGWTDNLVALFSCHLLTEAHTFLFKLQFIRLVNAHSNILTSVLHLNLCKFECRQQKICYFRPLPEVLSLD